MQSGLLAQQANHTLDLQASSLQMQCPVDVQLEYRSPDHDSINAMFDRTVERARERPILIVEDDIGMSTMLTIALEDAQYAVQTAPNGAAALERLNHIRPRLILLDIRMPVMDGPTFLRHLRAQQPLDIPPIIVMTAYRDIDPEILELGLPSISKPMNIELLLALIEDYVEPI